MKEGSVRRLPALLTAVALATVLASSLTACAGDPGSEGCTPVYQPGGASELVTATGSAPDVSFPTPLITEGSQVSTLKKGTGDPIGDRATVDLQLTILDGATGNLLVSDSSKDQVRRYVAAGKDSSLNQALLCAKVDGRIALTTTAEAGFGPGALKDAGFSDDDTLVIVMDIDAVYLGKADGINQLPEDGMPNVVTAPDGRPGIQVPSTDAPEELRVETVKAGDHATVKNGDAVVVHFSSFTWPAPGDLPNEVDSSWPGTPTTVKVDKKATASAAQGVPPAAAAQLVGTKVGSQVLVVIPPDDQSEDTIIVVIDVLGIQK
jgi:peptidylprolyl isomerase